MANVVIYYRKDESETPEHAVSRVNELIEKLETHHTIFGVFIDRYNESNELMELLDSPLEEIDYIYMNECINNEFDKELISQLSSTLHFEIRFFNEA